MHKTFAIFALFWTIAIFVFCLIDLSLISKHTSEISIPYIDKFIHFFIYVVFAILWRLAIGISKTKTILFVLAAIAYGLVIEIAQQYTGYRSYEWQDVIANSLGIIVGFIGIQFFKK